MGGTWSFRCNICKEERAGSYSRVRAHLLGIKNYGIAGCKKASSIQKAEMKKLEDDFEKKKSEFGPREVHLPCELESFKKIKSALSPITRAFGVEVRDQLDQEIARMFYTTGLPFNLAINPHFIRSYQFAASNKIDGYVPPVYNKLITTLLVQARNSVDKLMQPLKLTWKEKKSDDCVKWLESDPTRKPLINFMANSETGPIFIKTVNCFGEVKDKFFISNLMKEVINEVGCQNIVQIITDDAANCKAAGEIIEGLFPQIYSRPCVVHTLNILALKNIVVMLKRFKLIKRSLQAMAISEEWSSYKEDDTLKASAVKEKILNDWWWDQVAYIVDFTRPIYMT
ncbi:hypothetical protein V5N11_032833 [Cardamine amara subsp. amara]|uniref:DUF659 domain-containing protein n=1 Tax=Cardamine amara subsp. amara TaxID=228776 RepID=A0ABD0Z7S6_CARAN